MNPMQINSRVVLERFKQDVEGVIEAAQGQPVSEELRATLHRKMVNLVECYHADGIVRVDSNCDASMQNIYIRFIPRHGDPFRGFTFMLSGETANDTGTTDLGRSVHAPQKAPGATDNRSERFLSSPSDSAQ